MGSLRSLVRAILAVLACAAFVSACVDTPSTPTTTAPFSHTDLLVGTGADALTGSTVTVNYTGWLYDASKTDNKGLQFDSSIGRTPFQFTLGTGQVIRGWDQGIPGMKVGGRRRLVIPPSLAYGATRSGPIPPNATLVFDVEMVSIP
jgi:FKBP-type peptidyl-prolyl cis-trans isomerase FkpA